MFFLCTDAPRECIISAYRFSTKADELPELSRRSSYIFEESFRFVSEKHGEGIQAY